MDQEQIGKFILELRKKNNLTQKEFADKFGVTYQAVSKWENGKNIPDISIIKMICEEFNININDILNINIENKEKKNNTNNKNYLWILLILSAVLILIVFIQLNYNKNETFEFKTIEANCKNFNITGSIAYNDRKSSIYISNVEYCGSYNDTEYKKIECSLYDIEGDTTIKVSDCNYQDYDKITLEEYLKNVQFNIDDYSATCRKYKDNKLQLEITATDMDDENISYKIPLELKNNCD